MTNRQAAKTAVLTLFLGILIVSVAAANLVLAPGQVPQVISNEIMAGDDQLRPADSDEPGLAEWLAQQDIDPDDPNDPNLVFVDSTEFSLSGSTDEMDLSPVLTADGEHGPNAKSHPFMISLPRGTDGPQGQTNPNRNGLRGDDLVTPRGFGGGSSRQPDKSWPDGGLLQDPSEPAPNTQIVPEPAALTLTGLAGLALLRVRKRKHAPQAAHLAGIPR